MTTHCNNHETNFPFVLITDIHIAILTALSCHGEMPSNGYSHVCTEIDEVHHIPITEHAQINLPAQHGIQR